MTTANIPVIDISAPGRSEYDIAKELCNAAIEHGFIYIRNLDRDVPIEKVEGAFDISKTLFSSASDEKERCKIQKNNRGWSGMHTETLDPKHQKIGDFKEAFNFGEFTDGKAQQPVPSNTQPHEAAISSFWASCSQLCHRIVYLLGLGLGVDPPDFFARAHEASAGPSGTTLRFLHYPSTPAAVVDTSDGIRAGAHSDYGSVTLLFRLRGQPGGLQVLDAAGRWLPVPVTPPGTERDGAPPILVNIGDLLSYWTNGLLRSTVHRVVFPAAAAVAAVTQKEEGRDDDDLPQPGGEEEGTGDRYSIAFFCHPAGDSPLAPVPSELVRNHVPDESDSAGRGERAEVNPYLERKVVTADEHLQMRLRASYLSLYNEEGEAAS